MWSRGRLENTCNCTFEWALSSTQRRILVDSRPVSDSITMGKGKKKHAYGKEKRFDDAFIALARKEAMETEGIPIAAVLVNGDGNVIATGCNQRVQKGSPTLHGETACFENAGRLSASVLKECTMYTTLSPCSMCTGAILLYKLKRVVILENRNFLGDEKLLRKRGVKVRVADDGEMTKYFKRWAKRNPELWEEDIGV